jgi:hypothetical protein
MTEQELARHLKICRRQLYNWRMAGLVPYFKMGKAVRFLVTDVAAAIERMRVGEGGRIVPLPGIHAFVGDAIRGSSSRTSMNR